MSAAAVSPALILESEDENQMVLQWAYFPKIVEGQRQFASPQTFRLLVESLAGRLAIAKVVLRTTPNKHLATNLAALLDERQFELASRERIVGEFESRHGLALELLDIDLDQDDPLDVTSAIPRAIAWAARRIDSPESERISLSKLRTSVTEKVTKEWLATRSEFISKLNVDAVTQSRAIDGLRPSSYSYLNTVSAEQKRNRSQAMTVFPLLQPVLMTTPYDAVRSAIDEGRPLIDVLAAHHQGSKAMIRALHGVTSKDLGYLASQLSTVMKLLREIPSNWWPRDPLTWRHFANAAHTIARVSRHPITTATNQLWLRRCAQNNYELRESTPEDLTRLGQEIDEFMDTLRRALYWALPDPRNASTHAPRKRPIEIAVELKAGLGLDKLSQLARRFGDAYRRAVTEFAEEAELWDGVRWPPLGDGSCVYGDIIIHPLLTPDALREEGAQMSNCVASYVEQCMKGTSQIWSVRHIDGGRLATLETRIRTAPNGCKELEIKQHKGPRNGVPIGIAWKAVREHTMFFSNSQKHMQTYLDWKALISRKPLEIRQRHALMLPIIAAFEKTLSGKWSWQRLIEAGS